MVEQTSPRSAGSNFIPVEFVSAKTSAEERSNGVERPSHFHESPSQDQQAASDLKGIQFPSALRKILIQNNCLGMESLQQACLLLRSLYQSLDNFVEENSRAASPAGFQSNGKNDGSVIEILSNCQALIRTTGPMVLAPAIDEGQAEAQAFAKLLKPMAQRLRMLLVTNAPQGYVAEGSRESMVAQFIACQERLAGPMNALTSLAFGVRFMMTRPSQQEETEQEPADEE